MRRLARHALNALTALSLLLCVATVAVPPNIGLWWVHIDDGQIWFTRTWPLTDPAAAVPDHCYNFFGFSHSADHGSAKFASASYTPVFTRVVSFPLWPLA